MCRRKGKKEREREREKQRKREREGEGAKERRSDEEKERRREEEKERKREREKKKKRERGKERKRGKNAPFSLNTKKVLGTHRIQTIRPHASHERETSEPSVAGRCMRLAGTRQCGACR